MSIAGTVATYGDLPTGLGSGDAGNGYLVSADGKLYVWDGTQFPADGAGANFRGPAGNDGAAATITVGSVTPLSAGASPTVSNSGSTSAAVLNFGIPAGAKGNTGDTGADGANGTKWFNGTGAPGSVSGAVAGDYYLDTTSGDVYVLS